MNSQSVLLVSNDQLFVHDLLGWLEQAGYSVLFDSNGQTALQIIQTEEPDLVVLNRELPDRDGVGLIRIIRHNSLLSYVPIIIVSNAGTDIDRIIGLESGADDYLIRPFTRGEFVARVRAVLRRSYPKLGESGYYTAKTSEPDSGLGQKRTR